MRKKERKEEKERETSICFSFRWLSLVCALTKDQPDTLVYQ